MQEIGANCQITALQSSYRSLNLYLFGICSNFCAIVLEFQVLSRYNDLTREDDRMHGYIGTYTTGRSQGIYRFTFDPDTGALSEPILFAAVRNPKCVARKGSILASAIELEGRAG